MSLEPQIIQESWHSCYKICSVCPPLRRTQARKRFYQSKRTVWIVYSMISLQAETTALKDARQCVVSRILGGSLWTTCVERFWASLLHTATPPHSSITSHFRLSVPSHTNVTKRRRKLQCLWLQTFGTFCRENGHHRLPQVLKYQPIGKWRLWCSLERLLLDDVKESGEKKLTEEKTASERWINYTEWSKSFSAVVVLGA